jgi:hypothetical protein
MEIAVGILFGVLAMCVAYGLRRFALKVMAKSADLELHKFQMRYLKRDIEKLESEVGTTSATTTRWVTGLTNRFDKLESDHSDLHRMFEGHVQHYVRHITSLGERVNRLESKKDKKRAAKEDQE